LLKNVLCVQFYLHNVAEPRPIDPDMPIPIVTEVPKQKISLVPFVSALRRFRYIHIRMLHVWGITFSHDDIVALVSIVYHNSSMLPTKDVVQF